jgi:hypothetical protein
MTTAAATTARHLLSQVRVIERNYRLRRYNGRNAHSTELERSSREQRAWTIIRDLPRELGGQLTEEHRLATRIAENREQGVQRPELDARLTAIRRAIRRELAA